MINKFCFTVEILLLFICRHRWHWWRYFDFCFFLSLFVDDPLNCEAISDGPAKVYSNFMLTAQMTERKEETRKNNILFRPNETKCQIEWKHRKKKIISMSKQSKDRVTSDHTSTHRMPHIQLHDEFVIGLNKLIFFHSIFSFIFLLILIFQEQNTWNVQLLID